MCKGTKKINIKPCPFCGSTDIGVKDTFIDFCPGYGNIIRIWAYCRNCDSTGGNTAVQGKMLSDEEKTNIAYLKWNTRV